MSTMPRTAAQTEASRRNGRQSRGPTSPAGKTSSSMNAITTGIYARAAVLSDEERERVSALVRDGVGRFAVVSLVGAQLVARAADALVRLDRLDLVRERVLGEALEARVAACEPQRRLAHDAEVRAAVTGMVQLAHGVIKPVARESVDELLPAVRRLAEAVVASELPLAVAGALGTAVEALGGDDVADVKPASFAAMAHAGEAVVSALDARVPDLTAAVEREREHRAELLLGADDRRLKEIDRVRARVVKELDSLLRCISSVKELEAKTGANAESPPVPVAVDFKMVGGARSR